MLIVLSDIYEAAAEAADIPEDIRGAVVRRVREATESELVSSLAEQMHEALMDARIGTKPKL